MTSRIFFSVFIFLISLSAGFAQNCPIIVLNRIPIGQFNQVMVQTVVKNKLGQVLKKKHYARMTVPMDTSFMDPGKRCVINSDSIFLHTGGLLIFFLPSFFSDIDSRYQPSKLASTSTADLKFSGGPKIDSIRMIRQDRKFYDVKKNYNGYLYSSIIFYDPSKEEGRDVVEDYTSIFATYIDYRIPGDSTQDAIKLKKFHGDFIRFTRKYPHSAYATSLLQFLDMTLAMSVRGKNKDFLFGAFHYLLNQRSIFGEFFVRLLSESIYYTQKELKLSDEQVDSLFTGDPSPYDHYFKNPVRAALAKLQKK